MSGNATVYPVEVRGKRCRGLAEAKASTTPDPYPRGRSLHVTRAFQPGDEILCLAEPVLAVPRGPVPACAWCLSMDDEKTLLACSGCKGAAAYCGKDCQRQHWRRGHKTECKVLRRVRDEKGSGATLPSLVRMLIQALGDPRVREAIQVLEGNMEAIREKKSEWQDLWFQAEAAVYYSGKGTNEEAFELACKIRCNCHSKLDRMAMSLQADDVAVFLDTTFAMINHSCVPNAEWFTLGRTTHVVATAPLLEGDEITIQYRGTLVPTDVRRADLEDSYFFTCTCELCMARLHSYTALASEDIYPPRGVLEFNRTFSVARYLADERERTRLRPRLADGQPLTEAAWSKIYDSIPPVSSGQDPFEHFRSVWPRCRELVSAGAWALQPLPQALGAAVDHLVGQIMAGEAECKRVKGSGPKLYGEQRPDLVDRWTDVVCLLAFESIRVNPVFNPSPAAVSDRLIPLFNLLKGIKEASAAWSWAKPPKAEWTEPPQSPTTLRQRLDTAVGGLLPSISQLLQTLALIILVNSPTTTRQEAARMTTPPPNPAIFDRSNSLEPPTTRTQRLRLQWLPSIGREQNNEMPKRTWLLTGLPFVSESLAILHEVISAPGVKSNALRVWLAGAPEGRHDGSAAAWEMADNLVRMYCIGPLAALADLAPELLEEIYGNGIVD